MMESKFNKCAQNLIFKSGLLDYMNKLRGQTVISTIKKTKKTKGKYEVKK